MVITLFKPVSIIGTNLMMNIIWRHFGLRFATVMQCSNLLSYCQ